MRLQGDRSEFVGRDIVRSRLKVTLALARGILQRAHLQRSSFLAGLRPEGVFLLLSPRRGRI